MTPEPDHDLDGPAPPPWWDDWWQRFRTADLRHLRRFVALGIVLAALGSVIAVGTWVQQENLRDAQGETALALARIEEREKQIAVDADAVATYVEELRSRPPSPIDAQAVIDAFSVIYRIALAIEQWTGEPLPELPATTPPAPGG